MKVEILPCPECGKEPKIDTSCDVAYLYCNENVLYKKGEWGQIKIIGYKCAFFASIAHKLELNEETLRSVVEYWNQAVEKYILDKLAQTAEDLGLDP